MVHVQYFNPPLDSIFRLKRSLKKGALFFFLLRFRVDMHIRISECAQSMRHDQHNTYYALNIRSH